MQRSCYQALWAITLFWCSASLSAATLTLLDADGHPLPNAVVLVDDVPVRPSGLAVMDQIDMAFTPHVLAVPRGSSVQFPNSDDVRHHVYSFSPANRFELRLFKGLEAPPVAFEQVGPVILGCNIHDSMIGYILVTDKPWFQVSGATGEIELGTLPEVSRPVSWWHPSLGEDAPILLGELNLHDAGSLRLPVGHASTVNEEKPLSPLQLRFRKATGHDAH